VRATSTVMFLIVILMVAFNTRLVFTQSTTIIVPDDFSTIQEAVNAANPGDTVYVRAGTYQEIVMINKNNLVLTGESKHTTIIDGGGGTDRTVLVDNADNVEISGFTIQNSYDDIYIYDSSFGTVSGNIITTCSFRGIILSGSSFITISGNMLTSNHDGIELYRSSFVTVSGNTITNSRLSIGTSQSFNNTFSENTITKSQIGIYIWNCSYTTASGNTITNNTEYGIGLVFSSYCRFSGNTITNSALRGISLGNSSNCFVSENTVKFSATQGIHMYYSSSNTISENTLTSNFVGLGLYMSSYATVFGNTMANGRFGLTIVQSSNNIFYHNDIIDNSFQARAENSINVWDDGYPSGGNYWSDYAGTDSDGDGIGDIPYVIGENNQDNYPLMGPDGASPSLSYTLVVDSVPSGVTFTANSTSYTAPWSEKFANNTKVSLAMPDSYFYEGKNYTWSKWNDENPNRTRTVTMNKSTSLTAIFAPENTSLIISILSPENQTYSAAEVPLDFTVNGTVYDTTYSLDEQANVTVFENTTLTDLSNGPHSIILYGEDTLGNVISSELVYFTVDVPSAGFSLLSPENITYNNSDVPLIYIKNETCYLSYFSLDGELNSTEPGNTTLYGLADGSHQLEICANYTGSTIGEIVVVDFTVETTVPDTTPPLVSVVSPANTTYSSGEVPLVFTVDEPTSSIWYALDGQENVTITGNTTLTGLPNGPNFIVVYANDTSENTGYSETIYFTVTTTGISILSPENRTYNTSEIPLTYTINETCYWTYFTLDGQQNYTDPGNTTLSDVADGTHQLVMYSNYTDSQQTEVLTVNFTVNTTVPDTTPPVISVISPANITYSSNEVPLTFTVNEPTDLMWYNLDEQTNVTITGNTILTGLSEGTHSLRVYANDTSGNTAHSDIIYFTVAYPTSGISLQSPENITYNTSDMPLVYTRNETCNYVAYSLDGQPALDAENVTILSGLSDGTHQLTLYAKYTDSPIGESATVGFTIDTTSPNITDVSQAPVNSNGTLEDGAKVNATVTDTLSGVERVALNYTNDNGIWVIAEMANLEGDIWNGTLPAFPHGTNVTYTIIAEDKAGNTITTEDLFGYPNQYQVLPEFPSWIILPLFLTVTLLVTIYKKKLTKTAIPRSY